VYSFFLPSNIVKYQPSFIEITLIIIGCQAYLHPCKRFQGLPGSHVFTMSDMPCSQTPGERHRLAILRRLCVDFRFLNSVILPIFIKFRGSITSALRLTACRLAVRRLTQEVTSLGPRTCYPVAGYTYLPGRDSHPLKHATLPGRTQKDN
jgi:hypothetical protein